MKAILKLSLFCFLLQVSYGQTSTSSVKTIEGTVNRMLELISVEVGQDVNWEEYRNLFLPTSQIIMINPRSNNPMSKSRAFNVEEWRRFIGPLYKRDGFIEVQTGITINEFNGIANVFQSYSAKNRLGSYDEKGINSYQLVFLDGRWWIANITSINETEENKIPKEYLKNS